MPNFRTTNCIITASVNAALCKRLHSMLDESRLTNAEQTKQVYQYKNTKIKSYKNNAAIWYNKTCRARHITPTYANIKRSVCPHPAYCTYSRLQRVTIPDAVIIQFVLLKMGMVMLETCQGL